MFMPPNLECIPHVGNIGDAKSESKVSMTR